MWRFSRKEHKLQFCSIIIWRSAASEFDFAIRGHAFPISESFCLLGFLLVLVHSTRPILGDFWHKRSARDAIQRLCSVKFGLGKVVFVYEIAFMSVP